MKIQRIVVCIVISVGLCNTSNGQNNMQYIDPIDQYIKQVDSIIMEWSLNPASGAALAKTSSHFSSPQKDGICASAELYNDSTKENIYRLSYANHCDSVPALQDYYFYKTKIVLIRTASLSAPGKNIDQYYLNDEIVNPATDKLYLSDGYKMLKKMGN